MTPGSTRTLRPYLAVEYIEGEPIDVHCHRSQLGP